MGYAYNELVTPAVLFLNPGVTREEFAGLLDKTHGSCFQSFKKKAPWRPKSVRYEDSAAHEGLYGLADILRLDHSKKFGEFCQQFENMQDEHGLDINIPRFSPNFKRKKGGIWKAKYEVTTHLRNVVKPPEKINSAWSWSPLKEGEIWEEPSMVYQYERRGIIKKIISETKLHKDPAVDKLTEEDDHCSPPYEYDMEVSIIHGKYKRELFHTLEALAEKWPQLHPDFVFDWTKEKGTFYTGPYFPSKDFVWIQKDGNYYLSKETFDNIPASFRCTNDHRLGYADLILTTEAIKQGAWKLLSYRGVDHLQEFLKKFPTSKKAYEKAVWDSHTSLYAKKTGMTHKELLKMRFLPRDLQ